MSLNGNRLGNIGFLELLIPICLQIDHDNKIDCRKREKFVENMLDMEREKLSGLGVEDDGANDDNDDGENELNLNEQLKNKADIVSNNADMKIVIEDFDSKTTKNIIEMGSTNELDPNDANKKSVTIKEDKKNLKRMGVKLKVLKLNCNNVGRRFGNEDDDELQELKKRISATVGWCDGLIVVVV